MFAFAVAAGVVLGAVGGGARPCLMFFSTVSTRQLTVASFGYVAIALAAKTFSQVAVTMEKLTVFGLSLM